MPEVLPWKSKAILAFMSETMLGNEVCDKCNANWLHIGGKMVFLAQNQVTMDQWNSVLIFILLK